MKLIPKGNRVLITGGASGFGKALAEKFAEEKWRILIADINPQASEHTVSELTAAGVEAHWVKCDITSQSDIDDMYMTALELWQGIDVLINNAGIYSGGTVNEVDEANWMKVIDTNLIGTFNVLKKCQNDKSIIIFLSTSRVYSIHNLRKLVKQKNILNKINPKFKINEEFETNLPKSLYGFSKLCSEELIKEYNYSNNIKYIINRFGVIAGPWQFGKQDQGFVSLWVAKHLFKKKLSYIGFGGYGNQIRDIIHIEDVCEIIFLQIKNLNKKFNNTFNIGGGIKNTISLRQLTIKCEKLIGHKLRVKKVKKTSKFDIPYYVTDNKKVSKYYKWRPLKNIDQILKDVYTWLRIYKKLKIYFN